MSSETEDDSAFAAALNRAGLRGGADGEALHKLVSTYLTLPDTEPQECDEDFEGHYNGNEDDNGRDSVDEDEPLYDPGDDLCDPFEGVLSTSEPEVNSQESLTTQDRTPSDGLATPQSSITEISSPASFLTSTPTQSSPPCLESSLPVSSIPCSTVSPCSSSIPSASIASTPSSTSTASCPALSIPSTPSDSSTTCTVSTACRQSQLRCERRPRKPSPPRTRHPTSDEKLEKFYVKGCGCKKNNGDECCGQFDQDYYYTKVDECNGLSREALDMVIIGQIMAFISIDSVVGPQHKHAPSPWQATRVSFYHAGKPICGNTFRALHGIGRSRFKALKAHYLACGLQERLHGNTKRLPYNTLSFQESQNTIKFIKSYAHIHAILLPGRIPGYKRDDLQLLPSSTTKKAVWLQYKVACEAAGLRVVALNTFCSLWRNTLPYITVMRPMTDICAVCQQNSIALLRSANTPEEDKSEIVLEAEKHLTLATQARSYMKGQVDASRRQIDQAFMEGGVLSVSPVGSSPTPCSKPITIHFSFDFAQQIHYPHSPQQPGPIYFLTPRKAGIFGVCCEAIPRQVNYLIDEGMNIGKGANCIISLLHHFLSTHNLGEAHLQLHADNCVGQNKNRYVMQYLAWRVSSGLNETIEISFLLVGHTKFAPDWCFGLLKQHFRRASVGCLDDLVKVVEESAETNHAQLVGREDGTVLVEQYDWASFFTPYFKRTAFDGIKSWHHFKFSSDTPGQCKVRVYCDDQQEQTISFLSSSHKSWKPSPNILPSVITPPGLSEERRKYLYHKIREFVPEQHKDTVCPHPSVRVEVTPTPSPSPSPSPPTRKRQRRA